MPPYQLTIITPVFRGAAYIERCLRNVLDQDCSQVEHLIIDGGSTDGTREIVERFQRDCDRIRFISEPDHGQTDAMNKGIRLAGAPVISFLNADDTYEPGTLRRVLELLPTLPEPGFLVGDCQVLDESGQVKEVNRPSHLRLDDLLVGSPRMPYPINPCAYFYHRSLHDRVGLYDVNEEYAMDLEFLLRALPVATVRYVSEVWGNFLMLPGTKTYEDFACGMGARRVDLMLSRATAKLPQPRRLVVQFRRFLNQFNKVRRMRALLTYYYRNPAKIIWRLKCVFQPAAALSLASKAKGIDPVPNEPAVT